jgi:hypothetical protein
MRKYTAPEPGSQKRVSAFRGSSLPASHRPAVRIFCRKPVITVTIAPASRIQHQAAARRDLVASPATTQAPEQSAASHSTIGNVQTSDGN